MKKYLTILLLLNFWLLKGQESNNTAKPEEIKVEKTSQNQNEDSHRFFYCQISGTEQLLSTKVTVKIDFGQETKLLSDNRMKDEDGNVKFFNSMIDALNYMGDKGWEFVQAYVVTIQDQNVYYYLLKKKK